MIIRRLFASGGVKNLLGDYKIIDHDYEENVFWILVHIMIIKKWRDVLKDETPRFFELVLKFDLLLRKNLPKIYIHFLELSVFRCVLYLNIITY